MELGGHDGRDGGGDWAVPATALTHALRTPLNALKGWAGLLAGGELGRLPPDAAAATAEMRRAVAELERAVELAGPLAPAAPQSEFEVELAGVLAGAFTAVGFRCEGTATLALPAPAWRGWRPLFAALAERCAAEGAGLVEVRADRGGLTIRADAPRAAAGDADLAALAAVRRAAAGGLVLDWPAGGPARLEGSALNSGTGRTTFRQ